MKKLLMMILLLASIVKADGIYTNLGEGTGIYTSTETTVVTVGTGDGGFIVLDDSK